MKRHLLALLLSPALGACVGSVNPLYTDATLASVPALVGTWVGESGGALVVTARDSTSYRLVLAENDGSISAWVGRVTTLGERRWLDVEPEELPAEWSDDYRGAFLPVRQFWTLRRVDSVLVGSALNYDSLKVLLERDPAAVAHVVVGDRILLTAQTAVLRAFVAGFAERPGVLEDADVMRRVSAAR